MESFTSADTKGDTLTKLNVNVEETTEGLANAVDRANHTGAQAISTITGLQSTLDGKAATSHNHAASAITSGTLSTARLGSGTADDTVFLRGDGTWAEPPSGGEGGGVTDHGSLTGLSDDDHTQYLNNARGDARYDAIGAATTAQAAAVQRANHTGTQAISTVTGLQAAIDGKAATSHSHAAADITSGTIATARLGSGSASSSTYLRGDQTWGTPEGAGGATWGSITGTLSSQTDLQAALTAIQGDITAIQDDLEDSINLEDPTVDAILGYNSTTNLPEWKEAGVGYIAVTGTAASGMSPIATSATTAAWGNHPSMTEADFISGSSTVPMMITPLRLKQLFDDYASGGGGDVTAPTITSITVGTNGTAISVLFSEAVTSGTDGFDDFTLSLTGGAATMAYASGDGTSTLVYTANRTILDTETGTADYTQPGDGIQDSSGNVLATDVGTTVTNNSTETGGGGGSFPDLAALGYTQVWVGDDAPSGSIATWPAMEGADATQATSGSRPARVDSDLNGHHVVNFAGDDWMEFTNFNAKTVLIVFQHNDGSQDYAHLLGEAASNPMHGGAGSALWASFAAPGDFSSGPTHTNGVEGIWTTPIKSTSYQVVSAKVVGAGSAATLNRIATSNGAETALPDRVWNGKIACIAMATTEISDVDREAAEDAVGAYYGITITH